MSPLTLSSPPEEVSPAHAPARQWAGRPLPPGEALRKGVHAGMGGFALALAWLSWPAAAACAVAAFLFNLAVLPRLLGHRLVSARPGSSDLGVLCYPLVVLGLILVFRQSLELAAFGWGVLALGDAAAGVVGLRWGRRTLPWNAEKSWVGLAAGWLAGWVGGGLFWLFVVSVGPRQAQTLPGGVTWMGLVAAFAAAAAVAALVESAPLAVDDNLLAPLAGAVTLATLLLPWAVAETVTGPWPWWSTDLQGWLGAVAVNGGCAALALWKRILSPAGIAAALAVGLATWGFGGVRIWLLLLVFLVLGSGATRVGWKRKAALGIAEGEAGRRGLGNVVAKGAVVGVAALLTPFAGVGPCSIMAVAALAAALADTAGSELGKALGRRAYGLPRLRPVRPGTPGAVSLPGTAATVSGGALIGGLAWGVGLLTAEAALLSAGMGVGAALAESFFDRQVGHHGVNLTLTVTAAVGAGALAVAAGFVP